MKAVVCNRFGGPEVLRLQDLTDPSPAPGEVLVKVQACAVNFPDLLTIQDRYQFKPGLPFVPGSEVSGVITAVGSGVDGLGVGDRVIGSASVGGLAENAVVNAEAVFPLPEGIGPEDAAGLLYAYGTSYYALRDRADLQRGESLLVLGSAGAVGLAAIELGHLMGARVIAAASTNEKLALCTVRGADAAVNYSTEDLKARVRELTDGVGADVVFDPVGGAYSEAAVRSTAWNGRYLVIGFASGEIPHIPLNLPLLRGCSIVGVFYGAFAGRWPEQLKRGVSELLGWLEKGELRPHTSRTYPIEDAAEAFRDLEGRRAMGRVLVTPGGSDS